MMSEVGKTMQYDLGVAARESKARTLSSPRLPAPPSPPSQCDGELTQLDALLLPALERRKNGHRAAG